jgi:cation diffusion facilitator CzcD-associated flavoprotein CzcO
VPEHDVVIIGAGQGGIASALALKDRGAAALVVDEADQVASRWQGRYDCLRLNSSRPTSHLPGRPYPKGTPMFPTRDQVVEHIKGHARDAGLELLLGTRVERLSRGNGGWTVETHKGEIDARQVVLATGYENVALVPDWDGREGFAGELIHSAEYRNADRFRSRRVLVVGPGCSGMEIAHDVARGGGGEGLARGANAADDHLSRGRRRLAGRVDRHGVAVLPDPVRERVRPLRKPPGFRRPERVWPSRPRGRVDDALSA